MRTHEQHCNECGETGHQAFRCPNRATMRHRQIEQARKILASVGLTKFDVRYLRSKYEPSLLLDTIRRNEVL